MRTIENREKHFIETISQFIDKVNLKLVLIRNKIDTKTTINSILIKELITRLSSHSNRMCDYLEKIDAWLG